MLGTEPPGGQPRAQPARAARPRWSTHYDPPTATVASMSSPAGPLERKVRQLDNDVQSIYEMLAGIEATQRRHGNRLDEIDGRLMDMDNKLDRILGLLER